MSTQKNPRPWYCINPLVDDYYAIAKGGGDLTMLKTLKILRSIVVNTAIISITLYALYIGADATFVSAIGLVTLGVYNGVEVADYAALAQAFTETRKKQEDREE